MLGQDEEIENMNNEELLLYLLSKIKENKSAAWIPPIESTATIFPAEDAYRSGDLGFDPSYSEKEIFNLIEEKVSPESGLALLEQYEKKSVEFIQPSNINSDERAILEQTMGHMSLEDIETKSNFDREDEQEVTISDENSFISSNYEMKFEEF